MKINAPYKADQNKLMEDLPDKALVVDVKHYW